MPAISTLIAAGGLALAAGGAVANYSAAQEHNDAQNKQLAANQEHANLTNAAALKVQADNVLAVNAQQNVEKVSQTQMNLDAVRRQRDIIRQSVVANSQALSAETNAGAAGPGSSVVGGIAGNISGRTGVNLLGVTQNQEAGNAIFGFHADQLDAYKKAAVDGFVPATAQFPDSSGTTAALGAGLSSLGGGLVKSEGVIGRVSNYFGGGNGPVGTFMDGGNNGAPPVWSQ
jgi:hypothetical protein